MHILVILKYVQIHTITKSIIKLKFCVYSPVRFKLQIGFIYLIKATIELPNLHTHSVS